MRLQMYSSKIFEMMSDKTKSGIVVPEKVAQQTKSTSTNTSGNAKTLIDFFKSKGLKVIDKRPNGGCLWVIGSESEIGSIVREACRKFHVGGNYGSGRATGQKSGWFTRAQK